ncbi:unnamed protein product, partial [Gongylonema pulchrum]|uniref:Transcriptional regulator n=1 Tax=Gongylonema pulchrum TaxID=637853 RepID=A0A183ELV4_9BILA
MLIEKLIPSRVLAEVHAAKEKNPQWSIASLRSHLKMLVRRKEE